MSDSHDVVPADIREAQREAEARYLDQDGYTTRPPGIFQLLAAPLTLNQRLLRYLGTSNNATLLAVILLFVAKLLDFTNIQSFNISFSYQVNGQESVLSFFVQPLFIVYICLWIKMGLRLYGIDKSLDTIFRLVCFAMVWTLVSWVVNGLLSLLGTGTLIGLVNLVFLLIVAFGYFGSIVLGVRDDPKEQDFLVMGVVVTGSALAGLFIPLTFSLATI